MRPSDRAWLAMAGGIAIWDLTCAPGEMLSEASGRYARDHPIAAYAVVVSVALHLIDRLPKRIDPIHWAGVGLRSAGRSFNS